MQGINELLTDRDAKVCVVSHANPDGDALGSALALGGILLNFGLTEVSVVMPNSFPEFLSWMPWSKDVIIGTKNPNAASRAITGASVVFCVDFNALERTENLQGYLAKSKAKKVLVDHHPLPGQGFDIYYSDVSASSTAEMIYELACLLHSEFLISPEVAECLYAGIITDTGSLSYSCNNPRTYQIVANLVSLGVDAAKLQRLIYNTFSENRLRLLGYSISEKLVVMHSFNTAYISLSKEDLQKYSFSIGDTEGIVNHAMSIKGIDLAAIFLQYNDYVKISFRSAGAIDVNEFARNHFNGGGHRNASGGRSSESLGDAIKRFERLVVEYRKDEPGFVNDDSFKLNR